MTILTSPVMIDVYHEPAHYNRNCGCTIPEAWVASVLSGVPEVDDPENDEYLERFGYHKCSLTTRGETREQAIQLLGREIREMGYTGKMRAA